MKLLQRILLTTLLVAPSASAVDMGQALQACPGAAKYIQHQTKALQQAGPRREPEPSDDARRRRILALAAEDQEMYEQVMAGNRDPAGFSELKRRHLQYLQNELRDDVEIPSLAEVGRDGLDALWLLIQHADDDPALQAKALQHMRPLVEKGELDASKYALLTDRVLLASGKPQRFGSQLSSLSTGEKLDLGDETLIERERAALGLMKLADYRCVSEQLYRAAP